MGTSAGIFSSFQNLASNLPQTITSNAQFDLNFILATLILILMIMIMLLSKRISKLLKGAGTVSVEETLVTMHKQLEELESFREDSEKYLETVERRLRKSIQAVETVRFNPFKGTGSGGNQSFASAFLNELGDGLILSSLYASDRMSIFAKPVEKLESQFELTEEEDKVLKDAIDSMKVKKISKKEAAE
jgi:hypothetical protein